MKCPNCRLEQPDDSATCPSCGLIFAKWRERHPEAAPVAPTKPEEAKPANITLAEEEPGAKLPSADNFTTEPVGRFKITRYHYIGGLLVVTLVAIQAYISGQNKEEQPEATPIPQNNITAIATMAAVETEVPPPTPTPYTNPWKFQGKIMDILHLTPIAGVTVVMGEGRMAVTTVTDSDGKYELNIAPQPEGHGYYAMLSHPDFGDRYWEGDWSAVPRRDRIFVRGQIPFHGIVKGKVGEATKVDFSMFPEKLTDKEDQEYHDTIAPPAQD